MPGLKKRDTIRLRTDPLRGLLHVHPEDVEGVARYWPSAAMEPFVEHYWVARWDEPEVAEAMPQPNVQVLLEAGASEVLGISQTRVTRALVGQGRILGIKFRAGGFRPFVKPPVSSFTGRRLPLSAVFGAKARVLERRVVGHDNDRQAIAIVEEFLACLRPAADQSMAQAARIVARIAGDHGITRVDQLTREFETNLRALQRLFREYVGVGPKWVIQHHRLLEAADLASRGRKKDWAGLALDLGYSDQAHFIRDFKKLVGRSPADYARHVDRSRGRRG